MQGQQRQELGVLGVTRAAGARLVWLEKKNLPVINQSINQSITFLHASPEMRGYFEVTVLESEPPGLVEVTLPRAQGGMR